VSLDAGAGEQKSQEGVESGFVHVVLPEGSIRMVALLKEGFPLPKEGPVTPWARQSIEMFGVRL
jgi:hypothetical protein